MEQKEEEEEQREIEYITQAQTLHNNPTLMFLHDHNDAQNVIMQDFN